MTLPVPSPRTWSVGDLAAASGSINLNTEIRDTVNYLIGPPIAVLRQSAAQSVPNNTLPFTPITFDVEEIDSYGGHATNQSRYTAQVAGWYHVLGIINWAANASGRSVAQLFVNGAEARQTETPVCTAASGPTTNVCEAPLYLNVGDYVEIAGYQTSGAGLAPSLNGTNLAAMLCVLWISK
jgi:hypothetical protein